MKIESLVDLLTDLVSYNERSLIDYEAGGNIEMLQYCKGKVDAYSTILDAIR